MTIEGVRKLLLASCKPTAADWARKNALSPAYVSDVLNGRRDPGSKILKALGLKCVKDYRRVSE
jgi:hypothetical protein